MYKWIWGSLIWGMVLCLPAVPAASPPALGLGALCRHADAQAEAILMAHRDLAVSRQEQRQARADLIPDVGTYGQYYNKKGETHSQPDTLTWGIRLTQSYSLAGREFTALALGKQGVDRSALAREITRSDHFLQVTQAYFNTLKSLRRIDIARADQERLSAHQAFVGEQLKAGDVTKTALYRARAELAKSRTDELTARNQAREGMANLEKLTGMETPFALGLDGLSAWDDFSATAGEVFDRALSQRPAIGLRQAEISIYQTRVDLARSQYWPDLSLEAGYKENGVESDFGGVSVSYDQEDAYVQAGINVLLWDGGRRRAGWIMARENLEKARENLARVKKEIRFDAKAACLALETARGAMENLKEELMSARENFQAVDLQFKYGMADSIEIMDANTLLVQAQQRMVDARYTYYLAVARILHTRGDLVGRLLAME